MRYAPVMALMALLLATTAFAGANPEVTLPLHGKVGSTFSPCPDYLPVDCRTNLPVVDIPAGPVAVFLFTMNHHNVAGVQTAFEFSGAPWNFTFGLWDCQVGQVFATVPAPPWGGTAGTVSTAFTCVNSPALLVIGRMHFIATAGCIQQTQSTYPNATHVLDCAQGTDPIPASQGARLGRICVGPPGSGQHACDPVTAVEPATWGSIKAHYN
jgi:hypothetical protein